MVLKYKTNKLIFIFSYGLLFFKLNKKILGKLNPTKEQLFTKMKS